MRRFLIGVLAVALTPVSDDRVASAGGLDALHITTDGSGVLPSLSTNRFDAGSTDGFFANLGTNGRTCGTCHVESEGWTVTPRHAQALPPGDPLFTPNDGADCPPSSSSQGADRARSSEFLNYGLIRIQLAIPGTANFAMLAATNPKSCAIAPGSAANDGQLFLFRRPLPSTNLIFDSAVMWDGHETLHALTAAADRQGTGPLLFDLADQANSPRRVVRRARRSPARLVPTISSRVTREHSRRTQSAIPRNMPVARRVA